jgi:hypothetical protein
MNETPLEDQVHDALHRRADGVQRSPLDVTDIRTRARRIQRRRRVAAGAAVAAVLAIAVPVGLTMVGSVQRSDVPLAPQPPPTIASGTVRVDARSAPDGDAPSLAMIDVNGPTLINGDSEVDLPGQYDEITPYLDGWLGILTNEGALTAQVLDADFTVQSQAPSNGLIVSPDASRIAWTEWTDGRWYVVDADASGAREERRTELLVGPRDQGATPVGFVSDAEVVVSQVVANDGTRTNLVADGSAAVEVPGMIEAKAATAATGVVAGLTSRAKDNSTCSAVFDATTRTGTPAWTTCDHTLVSFSPDGRFVAGFDSYLTANGSPAMSILDAATGSTVIDFDLAGARNSVTGINEIAWEDDDTMIAVMSSSNLQYVLRIGLDGTIERVGGLTRTLEPGLVGAKLAAR